MNKKQIAVLRGSVHMLKLEIKHLERFIDQMEEVGE